MVITGNAVAYFLTQSHCAPSFAVIFLCCHLHFSFSLPVSLFRAHLRVELLIWAANRINSIGGATFLVPLAALLSALSSSSLQKGNLDCFTRFGLVPFRSLSLPADLRIFSTDTTHGFSARQRFTVLCFYLQVTFSSCMRQCIEHRNVLITGS